MKKFLVSSVVIIAFIAYCLYQKANGFYSAPIVFSKQNLSQTLPSPTNTPTIIPTSIPTATQIPTILPTSQSTIPKAARLS